MTEPILAASRSNGKTRRFVERFGPLIAFLVLFVFNALSADPNVQTSLNSLWNSLFESPLFETVNDRNTFVSPENLRNIVRQNSTVGVVALGMAFVIILGGIDLSVGSLLALTGCCMVYVNNRLVDAGRSEVLALAAAVIAAMLVGPLAGLVNGLLVTKGRIAPFIVTLGTMVGFRSLALAMAGSGEMRTASSAVYPEVSIFKQVGAWGLPLPGFTDSRGDPLLIHSPILAFIILAVVAHVLLRLTRFGRYVVAIGCNERASVYSAISVDRVKWLTYTLTGAFVAVASVFSTTRLGSVSSGAAGTMLELDAIAAVVIGGTRMSGGLGSIAGTVLGVLILGIINNMLNQFGVPSELQGLVKGLVIIAAVLIQRKPPSEG